jgi:hypothetical protein
VVKRGISLNDIFEENYERLSDRILKNPDDYVRDENCSISMIMIMKGVKNAGR